jgi:hypothetical protein
MLHYQGSPQVIPHMHMVPFDHSTFHRQRRRLHFFFSKNLELGAWEVAVSRASLHWRGRPWGAAAQTRAPAPDEATGSRGAGRATGGAVSGDILVEQLDIPAACPKEDL